MPKVTLDGVTCVISVAAVFANSVTLPLRALVITSSQLLDTPVALVAVDLAFDGLMLGVFVVQLYRREGRRRWVEMAAFIPLDVAVALVGYEGNFGFFRLNHLLAAVPLVRNLRIAEGYFWRLSVQMRRTLYILLILPMASHWCGCFWFYLAYLERHNKYEWLHSSIYHEYYNGSTTLKYLRSVYWGATMLTTVGFGDVTAVTFPETIYAILVIYMGVFISCASIASVVKLMEHADRNEMALQEMLDDVCGYLEWRGASLELQDRALLEAKAAFVPEIQATGASLATTLPFQLRARLQIEQEEAIIHGVPLFQNITMSMRAAISEQVVYVNKAVGDVLVHADEPLDGLYFLRVGAAEFRSGETVLRTLGPGDYLGDEALFRKDHLAPFTVVCTAPTEFVYLAARTFRELVVTNHAVLGLTAGSDDQDADDDDDEDQVILRFQGNSSARTGRRRRCRVTASDWLPNSMFRRVWKLVSFAGLLYNIYAVPRDCAFYRTHNRFAQPDAEALVNLAVFWAFDIFFIVDFFLHCRRFAIEHDGNIITDRNKIRNLYLRSARFWPDLISILPLDAFCAITSMSLLPFLRLNKILRFSHLIEYFQVAEAMLLSRFHIHVFARRIIRILSILVLSGYIVGCFWYYVAEVSSDTYGDATWVHVDQTTPDYYFQSYVHNRLYIIRSMYFGYIGGSTLGFGDIVPVNPYETLVATIMLLYGAIIKPALVGSVASLLLTRNKAKLSQQKTLIGFKWLVTAHKLPKVLKERVLMYFEFMWDNPYYEKEAGILHVLPSLRAEILQTVVRNARPKTWFFGHVPDDAMRQIYALLTPQLYLPRSNVALAAGALGVLNTGVLYRVTPEGRHEIFEEGSLRLRTFGVERFVLHAMEDDEAAEIARRYPFEYATQEHFCEVLLLPAVEVQSILQPSGTWAPLIADMLLHLQGDDGEAIALSIQTAPVADDPDPVAYKPSHVVPSAKRHSPTRRKRTVMKPMMKSAAAKAKDVLRASRVHPKSRFRKVLSVLVVLALLYNAFLVPFRLAFFSSLQPPSYLYGFLVDYSLDVVFLIDVVVKYRFKLLSLRLEGSTVNVHRVIWASLRWDVVCALPYELCFVGFMLAHPDLVVVVLTLCRLPKVVRLKYFVVRIRELANTAVRARPALNDIVVALRYFLFILFFSHLLACAWHYLAFADRGILPWESECNALDNAHVHDAVNNDSLTREAECLFNGTWIEFQIQGGYLPPTGGGIWERYSRCFNFGIQMLLVVSSGIIVPVNMAETLFCIVAIFAGIFFSAGKIGVIGEIALKVDSLSASIRQSTDALSRYMAFHKTPKDVQDKALRFMEYLYRKRNKILFQEEEIVQLLPQELQDAILAHCKRDRLSLCPLFVDLPPETLVSLAAAMQHRKYAPGDLLTHEGHHAPCMFFVKPGSCQYQDPAIPSSMSKALSAFGARSLLYDEPQSHTICSNTFTEVYVLRDSGLADVEAQHPGLRARLQAQVAAATDTPDTKVPTEDEYLATEATRLPDDDPDEDGIEPVARGWRVPDSHFRRFWDALLYCTTLYVLIMLPLRASYMIESAHAWHELIVWYSGDVVALALYALDTYLSYHHFAFMDHSKLILNKAKIRENYRAYLALDLATIAPYYLLALVLGLPSLKFLMMPLLLRAKRFPRYVRRFSRNFQYYFVHLSGSVIHIVHCILYYVVMVHWWACIWMFLHRYVEVSLATTWAVRDPYMGGGALSVYNTTTKTHDVCRSMVACYARAYYFVISFVGTVGLGDVRTGSHLEYFFEDIEALFGSFFFAALTSCFCAYFQYADTFGKGAKQARLSGLASYFRAAHTTKPTARAVVANAKLWCVRSGGLVERDVATFLPVPLRVELATFVQRRLLGSSLFLQRTESFVRHRLMLAMHFQVVCADSVVFSLGDPLDEVAFLHDGSIKLLEATVRGEAGCHVGRAVAGPCEHTVVAATHVELYVLDADSKAEVLDVLPTSQRMLFLESLDAASLHATLTSTAPEPRAQTLLNDDEDAEDDDEEPNDLEAANEPPAWLSLPQSLFK
ncbi:tetrameric potassium-selective cyclic nucleotide gated channel [Achlya hypogyna]|uniref:Tetrameric potassium-selective cyclic nucleotide gated channel n=1 Tax=Achlya hypogyna TaxID=1202772 RepID=A0A1V9YN88_ACHHY|nr:tetrameric potassium-selective cyclic nucleotide gated channel [Achlya hypogyna]